MTNDERRPLRRSAAAAAVLALFAGSAAAAPRSDVTVVELFTSQDCSSCPPANANAAALADRPDLLVLSFGVTYWDSLGWKDSFAREDFTERQRIYEPALGRDGPFTPQIVVGGASDTVGNDRATILALIAKGRAAGPAIALSGETVTIGPGKADAAADVWLVRYDARTIDVAVRRGENGGRTLPHRNVVRDLARIGHWAGAETELPLPAAAPGLRTAVLVQAPKGGAILAAVTD